MAAGAISHPPQPDTLKGGHRKWPQAPITTCAASGHNNNKLFVIPDWQMVVVRLGLDQDDFKIPDSTWSQFLGQLGQAVGNP